MWSKKYQVAFGLSAELKDDGIAVNALWPKTAIATAAIEFISGMEIYKEYNDNWVLFLLFVFLFVVVVVFCLVLILVCFFFVLFFFFLNLETTFVAALI